jgi:hypothetical protein
VNRRRLTGSGTGACTVVRAVAGAVPWLALASLAMGASPSPTAGSGGDPRSSGQGPGLVGDPLIALLAVLAIGGLALGLTLAYIRVTGRRAG